MVAVDVALPVYRAYQVLIAASQNVFLPDTEEPPSLTTGRQIEPFPSFVDRDDCFFRTARTTFTSVPFKIFPPFGTPFLLSLAQILAPFLSFVRRRMALQEPSVERITLQWHV